jgi:hypothetical protein
MSNRIDVALEQTPNKSNQRGLRNIIAVVIVIVFTTIFAIFSPKTEIIKANLEGEGCTKTEQNGVKCELVQGEKRLTLRECLEESPCNQAEYKLGKQKEGKQYILIFSEAFGKSVEVLTIDTESMSQLETRSAFYTEVKDSCKNKDNYTQDCFEFPVSEEQLKDITEQNQKYNNFIKEYSR